MTSPVLVTGEVGQGVLISPAKKLMIRALRATFTSMYPNSKLANLNIDLEYPYLEEKYPGIWVKFTPRKIQASGLDPTQRSDSEIFSVWYFEGTFTLVMLALTSKERDLIADGFLEAFMFATSMPSVNPFAAELTSSELINMTLQSDVITAGGQTESVGVPWDDDKMAYEDRYSFEVVGQVRSRVQPGVVFTNLSEIQVAATLTNVVGAPDNSVSDSDGLGTWQ